MIPLNAKILPDHVVDKATIPEIIMITHHGIPVQSKFITKNSEYHYELESDHNYSNVCNILLDIASVRPGVISISIHDESILQTIDAKLYMNCIWQYISERGLYEMQICKSMTALGYNCPIFPTDVKEYLESEDARRRHIVIENGVVPLSFLGSANIYDMFVIMCRGLKVDFSSVDCEYDHEYKMLTVPKQHYRKHPLVFYLLLVSAYRSVLNIVTEEDILDLLVEEKSSVFHFWECMEKYKLYKLPIFQLAIILGLYPKKSLSIGSNVDKFVEEYDAQN